MSISNLRIEYTLRGLEESDIDPNPFRQFQIWLEEAIKAELYEPNAMTVATVGADGRPSARMMLLKGFDEQGFVFYSNYTSRKGQELANHPWAALVFWWGELERQVRVEGPVAPVSAAESQAYFDSRPAGSRMGAWVSTQSQVIAERAILEQRMQEVTATYQDQPIPRPPYWGGYRLRPLTIEFWKGRLNRLHDRLRYRLDADDHWFIERLSP